MEAARIRFGSGMVSAKRWHEFGLEAGNAFGPHTDPSLISFGQWCKTEFLPTIMAALNQKAASVLLVHRVFNYFGQFLEDGYNYL